MAELENGGKLQNTTVIVSADHGESFEGGVYQHGNALSDPAGDPCPSDHPDAGPAGKPQSCIHSRPDGAGAHDSRARRPAETGLDARPIARPVAEWDWPRGRRGTGVLPVSGEEQRLQAPAAWIGRRDRRAVPVPIRPLPRHTKGCAAPADRKRRFGTSTAAPKILRSPNNCARLFSHDFQTWCETHNHPPIPANRRRWKSNPGVHAFHCRDMDACYNLKTVYEFARQSQILRS